MVLLTLYMYKCKLFVKRGDDNFKPLSVSPVSIPRNDTDEIEENLSEEEKNEPNDEKKTDDKVQIKLDFDNQNRDLVTNQIVMPFASQMKILIMFVSIVLSFVTSVLVFDNTDFYCNYAKIMITFFIISVVAITDLKKHIIPNFFIVFGVACRVIIYIIEFFSRTKAEFKAIFINDMVGLAIGFGVLFIVALLLKNSLGFGDVKLYGIIGIMTGTICTYATLIVSLLSCCVCSVILMITGKRTRKSLMSFAPFIFIGYLVAVLFGIY